MGKQKTRLGDSRAGCEKVVVLNYDTSLRADPGIRPSQARFFRSCDM